MEIRPLLRLWCQPPGIAARDQLLRLVAGGHILSESTLGPPRSTLPCITLLGSTHTHIEGLIYLLQLIRNPHTQQNFRVNVFSPSGTSTGMCMRPGSNQRQIPHLVPSGQHLSEHCKAAWGSHLLIFSVSSRYWEYTFSQVTDHLNRRKQTAIKPQVLPHCCSTFVPM